MKIVERWIHKIALGRWDEVEEMEKKWDALEKRLGGFPAKRRYQGFFGGDGQNTFVWEREWESFAAWEATYKKMMDAPETWEIAKEYGEVIENKRGELYWPLP